MTDKILGVAIFLVLSIPVLFAGRLLVTIGVPTWVVKAMIFVVIVALVFGVSKGSPALRNILSRGMSFWP